MQEVTLKKLLFSNIFYNTSFENPKLNFASFTPTSQVHAFVILLLHVLLASCSMLVFCFTYSSTLKMEATFSSEMSVGFHRANLRYIPEDRTIRSHR
jgi:hypothetical protein